jgi:2-haloacid dehalogenase
MIEPRFKDIQVCVFDAYGTLFDIGTPVERRRARLGDKVYALATLWRQKQLEYSWLRSLMGRHADFWRVTADALDYAMQALAIEDPLLRAELMELYLNIEAFDEVPPLLTRLKQAGLKTAILSNGSPSMLMAAVNRAAILPLLDAVISVEERGVYKPHPSVYQLVGDQLGIGTPHVCFVSSNGWDAAGAIAFGFQTAWVNRAGLPPERLPSGGLVEIGRLSDLPALIGL